MWQLLANGCILENLAAQDCLLTRLKLCILKETDFVADKGNIS
jgi:hypothetical protein